MTPQQAMEFLHEYANALPSLMGVVCHTALSDPAWKVAPASGSVDKHHCFKGGLAVHTCEVVTYVRQLLLPTWPTFIHEATCAAILHDYLKVREYGWNDETNEPIKYEFRHTIRHVAGSYAWWYRTALECGVELYIIDRVGHLMLSHHGRLEWMSPVEPMTREALVLHTADMLSARYTPEGYWR